MGKLGFKGINISFTADYLSKEYTFPFFQYCNKLTNSSKYLETTKRIFFHSLVFKNPLSKPLISICKFWWKFFNGQFNSNRNIN